MPTQSSPQAAGRTAKERSTRVWRGLRGGGGRGGQRAREVNITHIHYPATLLTRGDLQVVHILFAAAANIVAC